LNHHIRLTGNVVTGACTLTSATPIIDAAKALLAAGASPDDELHVDARPDFKFIPMSLGRLTAPRRPTPKYNFVEQR
jgi:hypothetical protein